MRSRRGGQLVYAAALALLAGATGSGAATLHGRVVGPDGEPRVSTLRLLADAGSGRAAPRVSVTDEEGAFALSVPEGASVRIRIESDGLLPVVLEDPPLDRLLVQRLQTGTTLEGLVVDRRGGQGIGDATVRVCDREATPFGFDACAERRADGQGRFRVTGAPSGAIVLGASSPEHAYGTVDVPANRGADAFYRIELDEGAPLSGRVVNDRGEPMPGARIGRDQLKREFDHKTELVLDPPLIANDEGEFRHPGVKARERWNYRGRLPGWYGAPSDWVVPARGAEETLELILERPAALQFGLVDEDGEPLRVDVRLVHQSFSSAGGPDGAPGDDGRYRFDGLPPKTLGLTLTVTGHQPVNLGEIAFRAGGTIDLGDLTVTRGITLSGTVLDADGGVVENAWVEFHYREPTRYGKRVRAEDGEFSLEGIPPGTELTLRADAEGYEPHVEAAAHETDAVWEPVLTPYAGVRGRVLLPGGKPAREFNATLYFQDKPSRARKSEDVETDDGSFLLSPVQPVGTHTLELSAKDYRTVTIPDIAVGEREWVDVGEIELDLGHTVTGVAVTRDGSPAVGTRVAVAAITQYSGSRPRLDAHPSGTADRQGRFTVTGLAPGFFSVHAQHPDYAPWSGEIQLIEEVLSETVLIEFSEGGIVHGAARDRRAEPVSGIQVGAECPSLPTDRTATTDDQGYFRLDNLPVGQCRVWAFQDNGAPFGNPRLVTVAEGQESRADFDLSAAIEVTGVVRVGGELAKRGFLTFQTGGGFAGSGVASVAIDSSTGRYRAELSAPGEYRVLVESGDAQTQDRIIVPEVEVVEHDFDIPINWIIGRIVDSDGNPIERAEVAGSNARLDLAQTIGTFSITRADGKFHLKNLQTGTYSITAVAHGYRRVNSDPIEVRPDTRIDGMELVLREATKQVRGRLIDPGGNPVPDGFIVAAPIGTRRLEFATHVTTGVDGTFEFDAPGDGPLDVTALSSDWAAVRVTGYQPDDDTPLTLQAGVGGQIAIRVTDGTGAPREGVQLDVRAEPDWLASSTLAVLNVPPVSGPDGIAHARFLPEGTYRVTAPGGATTMVTVYDGQTAEVGLETE